MIVFTLPMRKLPVGFELIYSDVQQKLKNKASGNFSKCENRDSELRRRQHSILDILISSLIICIWLGNIPIVFLLYTYLSTVLLLVVRILLIELI